MKLSISVDNFKKLREENYTYVDKSLFIEEVLNTSPQVQLITRPRRFGKTLNLSMLSHFFDMSQDNRELFKGLAIEKQPCFKECGSRPVIFVSFKGLKATTYESFVSLYSQMISNLYSKHSEIKGSLDPAQANLFQQMIDQEANEGQLMVAIAQLMCYFEQHFGQKVMLLIDEYDSPITEAYQAGYYEPAITFMRVALGESLKGHSSLDKAVVTGILRISKESIFSDLNNVRVYTVLDTAFQDHFGFKEEDIIALLKEAGRHDQLQEVRNWYNGYQIGKAIVYNPWSLISYLEDPENECQPYWINTSGNNLIHQLLTGAGPGTHAILLDLINDGSVETLVYPQTTLRDLDGKALWSLLLYSGYLTLQTRTRKGSRLYYSLRIPNTEVKQLYQDIFLQWMDDRIGESKVADMLDALTKGDLEIFEHHFSRLVRETLSYYDTAGDAPERVYHAFVLGLLANLDYRYHVRSNRESGLGRYDLMMIPKDTNERGVILEFKLATDPTNLDEQAEAALAQIQAKDYAAELKAQGVQAYTSLGIAFCGKEVRIAQGR